jgi:hypothetical protein
VRRHHPSLTSACVDTSLLAPELFACLLLCRRATRPCTAAP